MAACLCAMLLYPLSAQAGPPPGAATASAPIGLDEALSLAEDANIDLIRARLALKTAQANLRAADTAPNPVFSVNAVQIRPSQIGSTPYGQLADTTARIDLPLERGGKRTARTKAANALIDAARDDLSSARRDMREAVFDAYFELKAAERRVAILQTISQSYADSLGLAQKQQSAGALSNGDLARQSVEAARARTDAVQSVTQWHAAQLALGTLIGRETQSDMLATTGDWPVPALQADQPADLLAMHRPDVLAAQARTEAARRNLDGAHALRHPDVTVGMQFEHAQGDVGVGNSVGLGLSVPLPVRNRYNGEVDAASAALVQAEAEERKAISVATADIMIARQSLQEASERRREFDETQLPAARKAAEVAEFAYKHGATSLIELLDARRSLRAVELGAIDARSDEANAIARLHAAETTGDDR
ncbi:TolC family protein [Sphingobium sp. Sx8-8]|uniref:TolC family protein n=1 Tax=Sphingobium sp. Sx8-8 TaxID=2933617 RepID=UPI001F590F6C|nr:TolC family protein [Sphingobium sp. Sx8-8]